MVGVPQRALSFSSSVVMSLSQSESIGAAIGVNESPVQVGGDGGVVINPAVSADTQSDASAVTGSADSFSITDLAAGIRASTIGVGGNATVSGSVLANTASVSTTTSGNSQARSILGDPSGNISIPDLLVGTTGITPQLPYASDVFDAVGGIVNREGSIVAGLNGNVTGLAGSEANPTSTSASASTTSGAAQAISLLPTQFGVSLDRLAIGEVGSVAGKTFSNQSSSALTTTGSSLAQSLNLESAGLRISDASGSFDSSGGWSIDPLPFTIGSNGTIEATSIQVNSATAKSVTGSSTSEVAGLPALVNNSGQLISAQSATGAYLPGTVDLTVATADSILADGPIPSGARIGGDLDLVAKARLQQTASALATSGNASATATGSTTPFVDASGSESFSSTESVGLSGNLSVHRSGSTNFDAIGVLQASSLATTTTGDALAINGNEVSVPNPAPTFSPSVLGAASGQSVDFPGFGDLPIQFNSAAGIAASQLVIGESLTNGAFFQGVLDFDAFSQTTTGNVLAGNAGRAFGAKNVNIDIGQNIEGSPLAFTAQATSNTTATTTTAGSEGALAQTQLQAAGFNGFELYPNAPINAIDVGGNGSLEFFSLIGAATTASAVSAGTTAESFDSSGNVGVKADSVVLSAGYAPNDLDPNGLSPIYGPAASLNDPERLVGLNASSMSTNNLFVGGSGNVDSTSYTKNETLASNVSGGVESFSENASTGMLLSDSNVTIGDAGSVSGLSGIYPSFTKASTTTGTAEAASVSFANGIFGASQSNVRPSVVAGPNGGSITGRVASELSTTSASSVSGDVRAFNDGFRTGLSNLYLEAGQVGSTGSSINGSSSAAFNTAASTTSGNAEALSDATSFGISNSVLSVNGNVSAISQLVNTVAASTVTGNAVATATGRSVGLDGGLDGTSVHTHGNGTITAAASSTIASNANTVTGLAMST